MPIRRTEQGRRGITTLTDLAHREEQQRQQQEAVAAAAAARRIERRSRRKLRRWANDRLVGVAQLVGHVMNDGMGGGGEQGGAKGRHHSVKADSVSYYTASGVSGLLSSRVCWWLARPAPLPEASERGDGKSTRRDHLTNTLVCSPQHCCLVCARRSPLSSTSHYGECGGQKQKENTHHPHVAQ